MIAYVKYEMQKSSMLELHLLHIFLIKTRLNSVFQFLIDPILI